MFLTVASKRSIKRFIAGWYGLVRICVIENSSAKVFINAEQNSDPLSTELSRESKLRKDVHYYSSSYYWSFVKRQSNCKRKWVQWYINVVIKQFRVAEQTLNGEKIFIATLSKAYSIGGLGKGEMNEVYFISYTLIYATTHAIVFDVLRQRQPIKCAAKRCLVLAITQFDAAGMSRCDNWSR